MWQRDAETIDAHTTKTKISYVCVTDTDRRDTDGEGDRGRDTCLRQKRKENIGEEGKCVLHTGTEREGERDNVCADRGRKGERRGWRWEKREGGERGRGRREGESMSPSTHTHLNPRGAVLVWGRLWLLNFWKFLSGFLRVSSLP